MSSVFLPFQISSTPPQHHFSIRQINALSKINNHLLMQPPYFIQLKSYISIFQFYFNHWIYSMYCLYYNTYYYDSLDSSKLFGRSCIARRYLNYPFWRLCSFSSTTRSNESRTFCQCIPACTWSMTPENPCPFKLLYFILYKLRVRMAVSKLNRCAKLNPSRSRAYQGNRITMPLFQPDSFFKLTHYNQKHVQQLCQINSKASQNLQKVRM